MADDRSLDEFATGPSGADDVEADDTEGDATGGDDAESAAPSDVDPTGVDPAVPTATWTADAAACERCGERVSRRWFDDGALVCGDCKEW